MQMVLKVYILSSMQSRPHKIMLLIESSMLDLIRFHHETLEIFWVVSRLKYLASRIIILDLNPHQMTITCGNTYLLLAILLLFLPIPMHFSRCGANRLDAMNLWQLGHAQSNAFFIGGWPNTSNPGSWTMAIKRKNERNINDNDDHICFKDTFSSKFGEIF